jgi:hypothetical protein
MKTKLFLLTVCLGANFGTAEIFTDQPAQIINEFIINGCNVSNVSIKNA